MKPVAKKKRAAEQLSTICPTDLTTEDKRNWDFNEITCPEELDVCCLWEYARESAFVRDVLRRVQEWPRADQFDYLKANAIDADLQKIGNCQITHDFYFPRDILLIDRAKSFPKPWQSLTAEEKQVRIRYSPRHRKKVVGGFRVAHSANVSAFLEALNKMKQKANPDAPDSAEIEPRGITRWGAEMLLIEIDWEGFQPDTISQCFRKWISDQAKQRKGSIARKVGRPSGTFQAEAALDGLAIMRLLRHFKPAEAKTKAPCLWKRHDGKQLFRKREEAGKIFRKIFSLLPQTELPLSWKTKAGRSR